MAKPEPVKNESTAFVPPKVKKSLTPPVLKLEEDVTHYIKITAPMYVGRVIKDDKRKEGDKEREPATIIDCVNLDGGEVCQVIATAVIKSTLSESYPDNTYVGKSFSIKKAGRQPGKQYNKFEINELDA
jgi:hypothetical protein